MRKVTYKKLTGQNFLSVGNEVIVIDFQCGLNLITGVNIDNPERKNGSGKSALVELFFYALFGRTIRDIKVEFIVNNVTKEKGNVELEFDVETDTQTKSYQIIRQVKPSKVELWENGVDISNDSIANTNKAICELIGSNSILCKSCDILSLSDNTPFMAMEPKDKKKFIEDIFSLEVFGRMSKELADFLKENRSDISISSAKMEEVKKSLENILKQQESYQLQLKERENIFNTRKANLQEEISQLTEEIISIVIPNISKFEESKNKLDTALEKLNQKISEYKVLIAETETKKNLKQTEIKKASSVSGATCDRCLQDISSDHIVHLEKIKSSLNGELNDLDNALQSLKQEKNSLIDKEELVLEKLTKIRSQIEQAFQIQRKIDNLTDKLENKEKNLKDLEENTNSQDIPIFESLIEETQERIEEETESLLSLKQYLDDLNTCKFILGEEGVKSFVIKQLLGMLNSSVQQYINDLGMTMRCKFDEYFDEQITNDKGKPISYWNFSGAERRTVDLACAWAFKDMRRKISGVHSNVEWLDEILDSGFDNVGYDRLIDTLKGRINKNNLSCYAISHRSETLKHIDGETVTVCKEHGLTRRVEMVD